MRYFKSKISEYLIYEYFNKNCKGNESQAIKLQEYQRI